ISRHETLRTRFEYDPEKNEVLQVLSDETKVTIHEYHKDSIPEEVGQEEASKIFNLKEDQLIRGALLPISDNYGIFYITLHHIVADGWSLRLIIEELIHTYKLINNEEDLNLATPEIDYIDYSEWINDQVSQNDFDLERKYWKEELKDIEGSINLPKEEKNSEEYTAEGRKIAFNINEKTLNRAREFSADNKTTLYTTLMTSYQILLYKLTNQSQIVVGSPYANRENNELKDIVGFFVDNLIVKSNIDGELSIESLVEQIKGKIVKATENHHVPLDEIAQDLNNTNPYLPIFQVM
ncbi:condensation domain-containing protein, partial [Staphylococcus xylosus]|uniref:condensation domain-containing protein n=1 Tax=Staphylococcus xylosus TaxID=1288 RepID=UPI003F550AC1